MCQAQFDERNWERWYFGLISHEEVDGLLQTEDIGTFLIRASSSCPDTFVICVREQDGIANYQVKATPDLNGRIMYQVRDDCCFNDIPSLLSFYKRNLFKSTSLIKPVNDVKKRNHSSGTTDSLIQRYSENLSLSTTESSRNVRMSAPPDCRMRHSREEGLPLYVKAVKPRMPSPYEQNALKLNVGDIIRVLRRSRDQWEGELNGERGHFPFTHVEFVEPPLSSQPPES